MGIYGLLLIPKVYFAMISVNVAGAIIFLMNKIVLHWPAIRSSVFSRIVGSGCGLRRWEEAFVATIRRLIILRAMMLLKDFRAILFTK